MMTVEFWTSWLAFWIVGAGPSLLALVNLAYSLYLSRHYLDAIKDALKNSRYIYLWGPSLGKRGLIWSLIEIAKIMAMIMMPNTHIRLGDLDPVDFANFPPRLKRLLKFNYTMLLVTGIWVAVAFVLLEFK